ncbi:MAG: tetratricopeptide repeat protein [Pirellulaceae bacterium]
MAAGLVALLVIVILVAAVICNSWPKVGGKSPANDAAELEARQKLVSDAAAAADTAVDSKALAHNILLDKARAERSAIAKAAADNGASQKEADLAKTELVSAEASATKADIKALAATAAAKDAIQQAHAHSQFGWVGWVLLSVLLCSLFPLSATAFRLLEVPDILAQLEHDCDLLGSPPPVASSSTSSANTQNSETLSHRWNWLSYVIHCSAAVFATMLGAALFFREADHLLDTNTQRAMQFGFLGAYVYCLNLVYRRYTTLDLQPHVYLFCVVGLIAGMVFNYVAFTAITNIAASTASGDTEFKGIGAGAAAIVAFSLGYFPNLAIRWFGRVSRTSVHERQRRSDALPLSLIDGISELHESRLQDEGIDNVQNLAAANIRDLVVKTPFSAQQIVEWTDQAVLYLYLDPGEIESFRRAGVRTVSDFCDIWEGYSVRYKVQPDGSFKQIPFLANAEAITQFEGRRKALALQLATTEQRLDSLFRATEQGPNMGYVRTYLDNVQTAAIQTRTLFIDQICGRVGRTVRENVRSGDALTATDILKQVAEEMFVAAAKFDGKETVGLTAESLYGRAYLMNQLGRKADARQLYQQCTEKFPSDPVAFNDLAWLDLKTLTQRSAFETARTNAQRAVALAEAPTPPMSDLASYLDTLAFAEVRLGNLDEGVLVSKKAIEKWDALGRGTEPRLLESLMSAAEAYLTKGNRAKAKEVLDLVVAKDYANEKTVVRITQLQQTLAAPPPP